MLNVILLREHIPLQQGLRQVTLRLIKTHGGTLREHIPLQQGLRPTICFNFIS